jgi:putative glutamine amidotransferase
MSNPTSPVHIGICGRDDATSRGPAGYRLWKAGYAGALEHIGAVPVPLALLGRSQSWDDSLKDIQGVVLAGSDLTPVSQMAHEEDLCLWCRDRALPLLAIDHGLHTLNSVFGGSLYLDLPRELPEALQHRHPPEPGLRHMINVSPGTRLAAIYGEGDIIVNSEHRRAVQRLARGFLVSGRALDGVIEAIEAESDRWFAMGVQWHPASATASGLDIQLFRALVDACLRAPAKPRASRRPRRVLAKVA